MPLRAVSSAFQIKRVYGGYTESVFVVSQQQAYPSLGLWHVISEYIEYYHAERNHQGIGNRLITTPTEQLERRERLGGMLNFYYRQAA